MQLTLFTDYALRSLMFLAAHPDKISSVKEIAEHYGISRNHLVKVVHKLAQLDYIESSKGKGGGIRLARDAKNIRLGDLVKQLEPMKIVECFDNKTNTCRMTNSCQLKHYLHEAGQSFIATINKYTLADTVKDRTFFEPQTRIKILS